MLKKLRGILNSYTDEELEDITLWVNVNEEVTNIVIDNFLCLHLITNGVEFKFNKKNKMEETC